MNFAKTVFLLASLSIFSPQIHAQDAATYGRFDGEVEMKWLVEDGEDRRMELLKEFSYIDPAGKKWTAPKGWRVDGASIPRLLWTIVGSPFTGNYRRASVIHDYYCDIKEEPWEDVHEMFYWACRADGVKETLAKTLYAGVYAGGPRWKVTHYDASGTVQVPMEAAKVSEVHLWRPLISEEKMKEIQLWIERENPTLDEIRQRTDQHVSIPSIENADKAIVRQRENMVP